MTSQLDEPRCEICDKKTRKTLFREAVVPIYICSEKCLTRFFRHRKAIQKALVERDYWID
ncbi:hypothetical protein GTO27_05770 [Candidatus Bathyarchaeota archaeon]|nr:hypothetical protein [Candidatus Bathyarchaeota archaeon]